LDTPPFPANLRDFIDFIARYLVTPRGQVLAMILRHPDAMGPGPMERLVVATGEEPARTSPPRVRALASAQAPIARAELAKLAEVGSGIVSGMLKAGWLREIERPLDLPFDPPDPALIRRASGGLCHHC
jgi:primosomal protein N' (replication factor Y)